MMVRAYTEPWFDIKRYELLALCHELPEQGWRVHGDTDETITAIQENAFALWEQVVGKVGRAPRPLLVDCLYICAKLSGNRVGIKTVKRATKELWGKSVEVLPLDRRREMRRWIWGWKIEIMRLYPDQAAWDDFVSAWRDKTVDPAYFEEGDGEE